MARPADPNAKEALVVAARAEFARKGLRGARVEDITSACGLSKGAFYLHFESKEALFGELVEKFFGEITRSSDRRHAEMAALVEKYGTLDDEKFLEMELRDDLVEWARSLHTLIREGSAPTEEPKARSLS